MRLRLIILGVGALLISSPAWAADHWQSCEDAFEAGTAITTNPLPLDPQQGTPRCFDTNGTANSNLVDGRRCTYLDVQVHSPDGATPANVAVTFFICPTASTTNCVGITGINNQTSTWPNSFYAPFGYVDVVTNTGNDDIRTLVSCVDEGNERRRP